MIPNRKKVAQAILAKLSGGAAATPPGPASSPDSGGEDGLLAAAEEMIEAMKSGSAQGLASAMRSAFTLLESSEGPEAPEMPEAEA